MPRRRASARERRSARERVEPRPVHLDHFEQVGAAREETHSNLFRANRASGTQRVAYRE
jgi:hypothetical protein